MSVFLRIFVGCLVVVSLLSVASYYRYQQLLSQNVNLPNEGVLLEIQKGQTLNSVLHNLQEKGLLEHTWPMKIFARLNKLGSQIQEGEFQLLPPLTAPQLLDYISSNNQVVYQVQFIEGSSYKDALRVLKSQEKLTQTLIDGEETKLIEILGLSVSHLEGQFYPDTYFYHKGSRDIDILKRSHSRLQEVLQEEWEGKQENLPLESAYEALILASIIEKETGKPDERSDISGVFVRRLQKNMRLQTDPTVIYGLGDDYKGNIKRSHLKQPTPYNTYVIKGLPPSPIALVGRAAIHAAVNPKSGESLYFVARGDGSHQFSATLEEHNRAVKKYQLQRREDYRSSIK